METYSNMSYINRKPEEGENSKNLGDSSNLYNGNIIESDPVESISHIDRMDSENSIKVKSEPEEVYSATQLLKRANSEPILEKVVILLKIQQF